MASTSPDKTLMVQVDLLSWANTFVGGSGSGTLEFQEQARQGETVRTVLNGLADRFPNLRASLWDESDRSRIGPHIEIIVNDAILGVTHELDSLVKDGDHIILTGQYIGG